MARHDDPTRRVWPWVIVILVGLLATAGGSIGYVMLGTLVGAGAAVMAGRAVNANRAPRRTATAQAAARGPRRGDRRSSRSAITHLP